MNKQLSLHKKDSNKLMRLNSLGNSIKDTSKIWKFFGKPSVQEYLVAIDEATTNYKKGIEEFNLSDRKDYTYNKYRKISDLSLNLVTELALIKTNMYSESSSISPYVAESKTTET
jgi:hypothetical protein